MLQLKNIRKIYKTDNFEQVALNDINVSFRKNEFVSILGPSGSGKTTCLNMIGGLDKYTSGDLIINGKSSKSFKEDDWDAYRNNSVGFIFQSYNLISHLSVLDNVEMGMKLSGLDSATRRTRSEEVLTKVGLKDHLHKKPNQLSGGQMQRVAIARALANDPDIILADEPTGALDTETSVQIMELIKEIAKEKLVIMVTHNPELAEEYSDRLVRFLDGQIIEDTNPYEPKELSDDYALKNTSMSFLTALKSSGQNVMSKKWRTGLTAFASSVGIIGVALVLAISNGFSNTIQDYQTDLLAGYPISISEGPVTSFMPPPPTDDTGEELVEYGNNETILSYDASNAMGEVPGDEMNTPASHENILTEDYIDYVYQMDNELISGFSTTRAVELPILKQIDGKATKLNTTAIPLTTYPSENGDNSTTYLKENFDLLAGVLPANETELLIAVNEFNQLDQNALKELGFEQDEIALTDVIGTELKLVANNDYYVQNGTTFTVNGDPKDLSHLYNDENAKTLTITGVIRLKEDASVTSLTNGLIFNDTLAEDFIKDAKTSDIVVAQQKSTFNVLTGEALNEDGLPNTQSQADILAKLGAISTPASISIYPIDFESKEEITAYLDKWNEGKEEADQIEYSDMASMMTDTISTIITTISSILIAFASISLIVSMIMIGIIIYVSVLERTKEIGVLRALGARKKDITRLFNAETFIIGGLSGVIGIGITYVLSIPVNIIIESLTGFSNVASLNPLHAIALIVLSVVLTMVGGLLPSRMAAKKDPVTALRSE